MIRKSKKVHKQRTLITILVASVFMLVLMGVLAQSTIATPPEEDDNDDHVVILPVPEDDNDDHVVILPVPEEKILPYPDYSKEYFDGSGFIISDDEELGQLLNMNLMTERNNKISGKISLGSASYLIKGKHLRDGDISFEIYDRGFGELIGSFEGNLRYYDSFSLLHGEIITVTEKKFHLISTFVNKYHTYTSISESKERSWDCNAENEEVIYETIQVFESKENINSENIYVSESTSSILEL